MYGCPGACMINLVFMYDNGGNYLVYSMFDQISHLKATYSRIGLGVRSLGVYLSCCMYYRTKKYASLRYFDTCFMHNIEGVSDRE